MATSFDRWEKDPFFPAAEEVQESADRMESTYRAWIHAKKDGSSMLDPEVLRRDLYTSLGTTKWQLEEFGRAVQSSYVMKSTDDARDRHREFIIAIEDQIAKVENSLKESARVEGKATLPWVRLDEGECNELAMFLSGPSPSDENSLMNGHGRDNEIPQPRDENSGHECSKNSRQSVELSSLEGTEDKLLGHRRTASASADIGAWKIAINDDTHQHNSPGKQHPLPPRKIPSVSSFLNSMEPVTKLKWPKNGVRKWKAVDRCEEADTALLRSSQLTNGVKACFEKSKSCLDSGDECYNKQLYGWYGALQRQLQRSQYQVQYSRPVQVTFWILLFFCLIEGSDSGYDSLVYRFMFQITADCSLGRGFGALALTAYSGSFSFLGVHVHACVLCDLEYTDNRIWF